MADLSRYTLSGGSFPDAQTAEILGITDIQFHFKNRAIDSAAFVIPVLSADALPVFPFGSTVSIRQDAQQIFLGTVQDDPEAIITGNSEALRYELVGPWWHLEHTVFQQQWTTKTGQEPSSHITLFQDIDGTRITNAAQIREALEWAIGAGAPLQIGSIFAPGVTPPTRDARDLPCAEVIKASLRWTPDASGWIDYSTTPPMIHFARREDLVAVSLPISGGLLAETLRIRARNDVRVRSVTLKYEQQNSDDENTWTSTAVDTYPLGSPEQAVNAIVQTLELSGSRATRQKQSVVTRTLPDGQWNANTYNWFKSKHPWMAFIPSGDLQMISGSFYSAMDPPGQLAADGETPLPDGWTVANLPRELVSGSVTDWMERAYTQLKTGQLTLGIILSFSGDLSGYTDEKQAIIRRGFNLDATDGNANLLWFYDSVMATNAITQVYSQVTAFDAAEPVPDGLARSLYESLGTLYYDVSFQMAERDITRPIGIGNTLNLTGGRAEYETMASSVQEITWSLASGITTVKCGVPEHLAPQDIVEYLRGIRQSVSTNRLQERATGQAGGAATVYGSGKSPITTSQNPPGGSGSQPYPFCWKDATIGGTPALGVFYGTANTVGPDGVPWGGWWTHNVSGSGVYYAAVRRDAATLEVTGMSFGVADSEEALPDDSLTLLVAVLGDFAVTDGKVSAWPRQTTNLNFSSVPTINADGIVGLEAVSTLTRDPLPLKTLELSVFDPADSTASAFYLTWDGAPAFFLRAANNDSVTLDTGGVTFANIGGNQSNLDAGGLTFTDLTSRYCDLSIGELEMTDGEDETNLSAGELQLLGPNAKVKVGNSSMDAATCTVSYGFYTGSSYFLANYLHVDGNADVAGNLDAGSISTRGLTIGTDDFATAVKNIVKGMSAHVDVDAGCNGSGGATGSGTLVWDE